MFRSNLRKKFECLYEGISKQGNPTLLNEIYTELYITESESGEISNEHEVRQIETQPAAADLVPSECVHRVTEVRGFSEPQKEEYFRKRISDQSLADRIISHLNHCSREDVSEAERGEIPKKVKDEDMILKLGKLAYQQLVKGNLIFYEEDLRECGIDVTEASVYSGLCTQIFREELGLYQGKVFCFVHLSIQEHLAALYVHLFFIKNYSQFLTSVSSDLFFIYTLSDLHQKAVNEALQSKNGHLDLFLRFLLGLSVKSHQILLQGLMKQTRSRSDSNEETIEFIKKKIRSIDSPEKSINLFHCLNELGDHSLVEEIQQYLKPGRIREAKLSSS
ncbi:protein NLRC3-like [Megalobrama amblycephala]|uniref:protein NLRC3-like n=1 Tax=Megalobrama amblycephala TaxID=75352 RepID=UPI00201442A9|nr:protein NLRC3-like [Megalobrama amblycephala]